MAQYQLATLERLSNWGLLTLLEALVSQMVSLLVLGLAYDCLSHPLGQNSHHPLGQHSHHHRSNLQAALESVHPLFQVSSQLDLRLRALSNG